MMLKIKIMQTYFIEIWKNKLCDLDRWLWISMEMHACM